MDLHHPEEIKPAGGYKGMEKVDPSAQGLRLGGSVADSGRFTQPPGRRIWLGKVRFLRSAVRVDWDQTKAPYTWGEGRDLVYRYPLRVTNRLTRRVTARLALEPIRAKHASARLTREEMELAPGATETVEAVLSLPAEIAARRKPLYSERFRVTAEAVGIPDSRVTIVRGSDPILLTVTVPIPEEKLAFPLLRRRKDLPDSVTGFGRSRERARRAADVVRPEDFAAAVGGAVGSGRGDRRGRGLYPWGKNEPAQRYLDGLTAAAFLYDFTGDRNHLSKGTDLLRAAAEEFPKLRMEWEQAEFIQISHGVISMNTLRLGWATGSMRSPYVYQRHGMFNDFDLLAAGMDEKSRRRIIRDFIVPAAVQMRNHTFGLGNQQDVVNYAILYAGLVGRNWPLVAFAYDSDNGLRNQLEWDFSDDGLAGEGHYHTPALRPILYATELLYGVGIDLYDRRLYGMIHSPAADAVGKPFRDSIVGFIDRERFGGKEIGSSSASAGGVHLRTGITALRWEGVEVSMNWGFQRHRGALDRMSLGFDGPEGGPFRRLGGGNYSHSSLGQSIIIVDESAQDPVPARVLGHDVKGPVQFIQASSGEHFPGTTVTRTFALLGDVALILDRAESERDRTFDWCLRYAGGVQTFEDVGSTVSLDLKRREGSFTDKPPDSAKGVNFGRTLKSPAYLEGATEASWTQGNGAFVMAGGPSTRVLVFAVPAAFSAWKKEKQTGVPVLMVRRAGVKRTDFVAAFSPRVRSVEQVPVTKPDGSPARAIGARIVLKDGTVVRAVANLEREGGEVRLGDLRTRKRFATDFPD